MPNKRLSAILTVALAAMPLLAQQPAAPQAPAPVSPETPAAEDPQHPEGPSTVEPPLAAAPPASRFVIPGGRNKGLALEDPAVEPRDLAYWASRIEEGLAAGTARNADRDRALARAMRIELGRREGGELSP